MRAWLLSLAVLAATPAAASAGAVHLRFAYGDGAGHRKTAQLICDSDGARATGYLRRRDATRLCTAAYRLKRWLGAAPASGRVCTQIYGGPDHARVRGNVAEVGVDRRFSRTDGCGIADWNRAKVL